MEARGSRVNRLHRRRAQYGLVSRASRIAPIPVFVTRTTCVRKLSCESFWSIPSPRQLAIYLWSENCGVRILCRTKSSRCSEIHRTVRPATSLKQIRIKISISEGTRPRGQLQVWNESCHLGWLTLTNCLTREANERGKKSGGGWVKKRATKRDVRENELRAVTLAAICSEPRTEANGPSGRYCKRKSIEEVLFLLPLTVTPRIH